MKRVVLLGFGIMITSVSWVHTASRYTAKPSVQKSSIKTISKSGLNMPKEIRQPGNQDYNKKSLTGDIKQPLTADWR